MALRGKREKSACSGSTQPVANRHLAEHSALQLEWWQPVGCWAGRTGPSASGLAITSAPMEALPHASCVSTSVQPTAVTRTPHLEDSMQREPFGTVQQGSPGFLAASTARALQDLPHGHTHANYNEGKGSKVLEMLSFSRSGCLFPRTGTRL